MRWRSHVAPTSSKSGRGSESRIVALPLDVTDLETVGAARRVGEPAGGGGVEVLVNAADYLRRGLVHALSCEEITR